MGVHSQILALSQVSTPQIAASFVSFQSSETADSDSSCQCSHYSFGEVFGGLHTTIFGAVSPSYAPDCVLDELRGPKRSTPTTPPAKNESLVVEVQVSCPNASLFSHL